jgi:signal peptidase I
MIDYFEWRRHRRALKEAKLITREARRAIRKYSHRLTSKQLEEMRAAVLALTDATKERDWDKIPPARDTLDKKLDDHLSFARKSTIREYTESIAVAVLIALFLRAFVVEAFKIPSGSMIPTLQVGDHIFVNKFIYGIRVPWTNIKIGEHYREPKRGEVIVFVYPKEPDKDFIKRIIAVPGDTVEVRNNQLMVNGVLIDRTHVEGDCRYMDFEEITQQWSERGCEQVDERLKDGTNYTTIYDRGNLPSRAPTGPWTVPPDSVFVMGDNRDNSHDSRWWGYVPYDLIKGKAMIIWFSSGPPGNSMFPLFQPIVRFFQGIRYRRMFSFVR